MLDNLWVFIAGVLVFLMQAGFALLEAGLTRAKNVVNIFAKNIADAIIGILAFFATGYAFAFGETGGWFIGTDNFFLHCLVLPRTPRASLCPYTTFFLQAVFAATAVTIASGAMAEPGPARCSSPSQAGCRPQPAASQAGDPRSASQ